MQPSLTKPMSSPRGIAVASVGCLVIGAIACGSEAETVTVGATAGAPVVLAAEPAPWVDVAPSHGGTVVLAGAHPVEVVPHASGHVYAYVSGDAPPPPAGTELAVVVPVTGGVRTVELEWDGGERRWAGRVRRVEIVPGPVDVVLVAGGSRWVGHATTIVVLPAIVVATVAPPPPAVVVIEHDRGKHRKHRKHRGRGRGHAYGHGGRDVEIRIGH